MKTSHNASLCLNEEKCNMKKNFNDIHNEQLMIHNNYFKNLYTYKRDAFKNMNQECFQAFEEINLKCVEPSSLQQ